MALLVGKKAPAFRTKAVVNGDEIVTDFSLDRYLDKNYVLLFFYPKDFSMVCPTELHAFQKKLAEFEKRDAVVIGASTDTENTHWAWLQTPKEKGGIKGITYPIIADSNKTITSNYGLLVGEWSFNDEGMMEANGDLIACRGWFLIDKKGIIRHQLVNDLHLGRNVDEALRMIDALRFVEENGELCPADWREGGDGLKATREGLAEFLKNH